MDNMNNAPLFDDESKDDNDLFASAVQSAMNDDDSIHEAAVTSVTIDSSASHPLADFEENVSASNSKNIFEADDNLVLSTSDIKPSNNYIFETVGYENVATRDADLLPIDSAIDQVRGKMDSNNGDGLLNSNRADATRATPVDASTKTDNLVELDMNAACILEVESLHDEFSLLSSDCVVDSPPSSTNSCHAPDPSFVSGETENKTVILLGDDAQEISLKDDDEDLFTSTPDFSLGDSASADSTQKTRPVPSAPPISSFCPPAPPPPSAPPPASFPASYSAAAAAASMSSPISPILSPSPMTPVSFKEKGMEENLIEMVVSDPQKIGDGIGSYIAYKLTTKTNISYFRKKHWSVTRRFSDFLGLHSKLVEKHLHLGLIIPPAPEKAAIATTKIRLGSDRAADSSSVEFIERRRAALERYMQRTAAHHKLRADPDFVQFLELDADLPKSTSTSAMSGAGVLRLFNRVGDTVNKMTFKMDEADQWFEEKTQEIESLDAQLRRLHASMEGLVGLRRELSTSTGHLAKSAAVLSSVEVHTALSRALHQLAEAEERVHTIHEAQADADFFHLSETTKDLIMVLGAAKEALHERIKTFQTWQHAKASLARRREAKAKAELQGRIDKVDSANEEVKEWESKVERSQELFERISRAIKAEADQMDVGRVVHFKDMLVKYLEALIASQEQIVKVWESFLPEAKAIA